MRAYATPELLHEVTSQMPEEAEEALGSAAPTGLRAAGLELSLFPFPPNLPNYSHL